MDFIEIGIATTHEGIEPLTGRLYCMGVNGAQIEDPADLDDFLAGNAPNWDYVDDALLRAARGQVRVKAWLPANVSGRETLSAIRSSVAELKALDGAGAFGTLEIALSDTSEEDWANGWKQYYKPVRVGRRLVVVPEWEEYALGPNDVPVRMDPGAAFGTGTHETTRLCLGLLEDLVTPETAMLDIGTGSGILAVAALCLGAKSALGIDIDELAAKVSRENAALNGVADRFDSHRGDLATGVEGRFSLITANIVADVILRLAPDVPAHLAPGGAFIASGVIDTREEEVAEALRAQGLTLCETRREHGWTAFLCRA